MDIQWSELLSAIIPALAVGFGSAWVWLKKTDKYQKLSAKYRIMAYIIDVAVSFVYGRYVREQKKASADGKLSKAQVSSAMSLAVDASRKHASKLGMADEPEFANRSILEGMIQKSVGAQKSASNSNMFTIDTDIEKLDAPPIRQRMSHGRPTISEKR